MDASRENELGSDRERDATGGSRWSEAAAQILSTYRMATSVPMVLLSLAGVLLMPLGWWLASAIFLPARTDTVPQAEQVVADARIFSTWAGTSRPDGRWHLGVWIADRLPWLASAPGDARREGIQAEQLAEWQRRRQLLYRAPADPVVSVPYQLASPAFRIFQRDLSWSSLLFYLTGGAWTLVVWTLFGGANCRMAALRLGRDERVGVREALVFAQRRWLGLLGSPALILLGIVLLAFPVMVLGLLGRWDFGVMLAGLFFPLVLVCGLLMAILALGLVFGWPLMWATIGVEGSDAFDAISRSYAYTFQCAARYLVYALIAAIVGILGWLITWFVAYAVAAFSIWGLAWGMGWERSQQLEAWLAAVPVGADPEFGRMVLIGTWLIDALLALVWTVASAVAYSHFWCMATAVYLLLRRDADETELEDVYLEEEADSQYGLPPEPAWEPSAASGTAQASAEEPGGAAGEQGETSTAETAAEPASSAPHSGDGTTSEEADGAAGDPSSSPDPSTSGSSSPWPGQSPPQ